MNPSVYVKTHLREFKGNWHRMPVSDITLWISRIHPDDFKNGREAVYVGVKVQEEAGQSKWLTMDVESRGNHRDIRANLDAARKLLGFLMDHFLTDALDILLTGWGFRFCWPCRIGPDDTPAFLEFVRTCPEIDASIYEGEKFVRLAGYRGHEKQGSPPIDRHIARLPCIHDLWLMTPEDYTELTSGPADLSECLSWLPKCLPTEPLPDAWQKFLQPYREEVELAGTLFSGTAIKRSRNRGLDIPKILSENGVDFTEESKGENVYYKLRTDCPSCGKSDGNPWVTSRGRLRCFRATCEAGQPEGLPMSVWLPGALPAELDNEPVEDHPTGEWMTVEAVRLAISEAVKGNRDTAIRVTPGGGKSTTTLQALLAGGLSGRKILGVPEKSLGRELIEKAKQINPNTCVVLLEGRSPSNCRRFAEVSRVASMGYAPSLVICPGCFRSLKEGCEYFRNQREAFSEGDKLVVTSHAGLLGGIDLDLNEGVVDWDKNEFDLMVIDESPISTFIKTETAPWGAVQRIASKIDAAGRKIISMLGKGILRQLSILEKQKENFYTISRHYAGAAPTGSPWDEKKSIWKVCGIGKGDRKTLLRSLSFFERFSDTGLGKPETKSEWQRRLFKEEINLVALEILWSMLAGKDNTYLNFTQDKNNPVTLCRTRKALPTFTGRTIYLDGTMDVDEAETLFQRKFDIIEGRCELPKLKMVWIRQAGGKIKMSKMDDSQIKRMLNPVLPHLPRKAKVLIGTHQRVEETVKTISQEIFPDCTIDTVHYFSSRGRNQWQNFDAFVAVGTPTLPEIGIMDTGLILFPDNADRRKRWRHSLGLREVIQMVHRIRPIQGEKTIILIGREWPEELGRPEITIDRRGGDRVPDSALLIATERLMPFVREFGFIHMEVCHAMGVCLEKDLDLYRKIFNLAIPNLENLPCTSQVFRGFTYNIYNGNPSKNLGSKGYSKDGLGKKTVMNLIAFRDSKQIREIFDRIQDKTGLPDFRYSSEQTRGEKSRGLGYLSDVRKFYELMGVSWEAVSWEGTERRISDEKSDNENRHLLPVLEKTDDGNPKPDNGVQGTGIPDCERILPGLQTERGYQRADEWMHATVF